MLSCKCTAECCLIVTVNWKFATKNIDILNSEYYFSNDLFNGECSLNRGKLMHLVSCSFKSEGEIQSYFARAFSAAQWTLSERKKTRQQLGNAYLGFFLYTFILLSKLDNKSTPKFWESKLNETFSCKEAALEVHCVVMIWNA